MGAPPNPIIVLSTSSLTLSTPVGSSPAPQSVTIVDGSAGPFTTVTLGAVAYDAGQPTGWLAATLGGSTVPYTITLTPATTALAVGSYHAVVAVNADGADQFPGVDLAVADGGACE